jgi:hypothetical protein
MSPTRRRCLRRAGVASTLLSGVAGCLGAAPRTDGGDEPTATDTGQPPADADLVACGDDVGPADTRPADTGGPGVALVAVDDCPDLPVRPAVGIVREAATPAHPPRLRTTLTNAGDEPVRVGEGRAAHFEYVADDTGSLLLLPADPERPYPAEPDCWRLTEGIVTTEEYRTFEIGTEGSSDRRVDLYATPGGDACLPVGEYRFETTLAVVGDDGDPGSSARWGFSVVLE